MNAPQLRTLDLAVTLILEDPDGGPLQPLQLHRLQAMRELNLSDNGLKEEHAAAIAADLPHMPGLRRLDLACNRIGEAGVSTLFACLARAHSIEVIDTSNQFKRW